MTHGGQPGGLAWAYARIVVRLRWVVLAGWAVITLLATMVLPTLVPDGGKVGALVSADNPAVQTEIRSFEQFGFPLLSRTAIVQRDPDGLSAYTQAEAVLKGVALNQAAYGDQLIKGALPVPNALGLFPGSAEQGTSVITYLFMPPFASFDAQRDAAVGFVEQHLDEPADHVIGVTGSIPARAAQAEIVEESLSFVELATVGAIVLIVALAFRSVVAPIVTLLAGGVATAVALPVARAIGALLEVPVPEDIRPVMVALLLGTVTDYTVFFLASLRGELRPDRTPRQAAVAATAATAPIVTVAGLTVAVGTGVLVVAKSGLFRGFGPGMALTVMIGLIVAVTLVPAIMAVLGGGALWPSARRRPSAAAAPQSPLAPAPPVATAAPAGSVAVDAQAAPEAEDVPRSALAMTLTRRGPAAAVTAGCVALLALAALPLLHLQLGLSFVGSLPDDAPVAVAAQAAREGFSPGILSPTELLLEGEGLGAKQEELTRLAGLLRQAPGVDAVLGPGTLPVPDEYDVFINGEGDAARFLVIYDSPALGADAIDDLDVLQQRLPALIDQVGLDVRAGFAGDTALSALVVDSTTDDLVRISLAALLANLVMLVLFLRAFWTSLALLAASVLALLATLGLTVLLFQDALGSAGLTFYVPFAAAVLLVSLGSDYNIFAVGRVWDEARSRTLIEAIRVAVPQSTRTIMAAALALAASFGLLALVPLQPFRELGFAMALGIVLDAVVVRSLLVPSILTLIGERSSPSGRRRRTQEATPPAPVAVS